MNTDPKSKDYFNESYLFNSSLFHRYKSKEYLNSGLLDSDEAFGFYNIVFLHKATGLRFEYSVYENYSGHAEYKILDIFIKTMNQERLSISEVDFTEKCILTSNVKIPFSDFKKDAIGD